MKPSWKLSPAALHRVAFVMLCVIWGSTWLALKIGATNVPPAFFSGTRWTAAGLILLAWQLLRGERIRVRPHLWGRLAGVGLLMISLTAVTMMYGLRHVASGLASVISAALTPIALLAFAVVTGQERCSRRQLGGIALGIIGILVLFGPDAVRGTSDPAMLVGAAALIVSCLVYALGSVWVRPLMRAMSTTQVAGLTNLIGGLVLLALAIPFEPGAREAMSLAWGTTAWLAWAFLLLVSSLLAAMIYLILLRDWGASRAGTYAFISPVVAVLIGVAFGGERLQPGDAFGMLLMLGAALLLLRRPATTGSS